MLDNCDKPRNEITDTISRSSGLHIIAGVHGDKTPELTDNLGLNYFEPKHFVTTEDGLVTFTPEALDVIKSVLSPVGCLTAKIHEGPMTLFKQYWSKISGYLTDNVDYTYMNQELAAQRKGRGKVGEILPASMAGTIMRTPQAKPKPSARTSKRYTPPKNKR